MHTVVELATFIRCAEEVGLTDNERFDLISMIATRPDAGDVIEGTGGVRKLRLAGRGKGKSGGYRVITFFSGPMLPVFLITIYSKGAKADLKKAERNELADIAEAILEPYTTRILPFRPRSR